MKLKSFRFSDEISLKENKFEPLELDSLFSSLLKPENLSTEGIKIYWFDVALSNGYLTFSVDGNNTNLLIKKLEDLPEGNRKDIAENDTFRDIIFEAPSKDPFISGDFRELKFKGEITTGTDIDYIDCPYGKFWFEAVLRGNYKEVPARDGMARNDLIFTLATYKTEDSKLQLLILEIAHPDVLEGGLINLFLARPIHAHEIEQF